METYYWETEEYHANNMVTMSDYLDNHLPDNFDVLMIDGTYAEIKDTDTGKTWAVHASGNGDSNSHKAEFAPLD